MAAGNILSVAATWGVMTKGRKKKREGEGRNDKDENEIRNISRKFMTSEAAGRRVPSGGLKGGHKKKKKVKENNDF